MTNLTNNHKYQAKLSKYDALSARWLHVQGSTHMQASVKLSRVCHTKPFNHNPRS